MARAWLSYRINRPDHSIHKFDRGTCGGVSAAMIRKCSGIIVFLLFFLAVPGFFSYGEGVSVVLHIDAERSLNFTSDQLSFNFTFPDFQKGSATNTAQATYTFSANDAGRMQSLVLARVDQDLPGIRFEAQMGSFSKTSGTAHLVSANPGFVPLTTSDIGLADKVIDEGDGRILDGTAPITYRAVATEDLTAGQHFAVITVSFVDN